ncbi:RHS repeat-associated core domain-containing protein [Streptomyces sp. NPDC048416]|uniref:RHS repeat-associated core domain-containing protein n=1 Tax=Streptomyces sp. NPDC048416 TaxID=3365546 RepID=UPI003720149A
MPSTAPSVEPGPAPVLGTPVWLGRPGSLTKNRPADASGRTPDEVAVSVAGRDEAQQAGINGVLVSLSDTATNKGDGKVSVGLEYSGFANAYGGDYASRLQLVQLPACALTQPAAAQCRTATPLPFHNDYAHHRLVADVTLPVADAAPKTASPSVARLNSASTTSRAASAAAQPMVLAAAPAPGGAGGTYTATALAPSGSWSAGTSTGDFNWTYPISVPPPLGGSAPGVSLSYDSASLDGRTSATNNQASWIGDGWDYDPGFIERSYKPCSKDGQPDTVGDNCWSGEDMTMSLGGRSVKLVKDDATGTWRENGDDGSKVEHLTGAANGAQNGEYWRITATNGEQYYFGLNHAPGSSTTPATNSAWTAPVFGNNAGEPCHGSTFDTSWCQQAWRWGLDFVVDANQNVTTYAYNTESNYYARGTTDSLTPYVRGGYLTAITYGQRLSDVVAGTKAAAQVVFTTGERCLPDTKFTCASNLLNATNAGHWPDVPFDQNCPATGTCTNHAPSFWSTKRLTTITTQVLVGNSYSTVDTYALTHQFPAPGDTGKPALWLASVTRTGHDGGTETTPAVTFMGQRMANRVGAADNLPPIFRLRINAINTESGGQIDVVYKDPECVKGTTMPASPDSNSMACYPVYWTPQGASDPVLDWFHKYLVQQVTEVDETGIGAAAKTTSYDYVGGAAWHHDDEELADPKNRTWGQFRGYGEVITRTGAAPQTLTQASTLYMRGMNGDVKADGSKRSVTVTDSSGGKLDDNDQLAGFARESRTYDTNGGALQSATLNDPWSGRVTATHKRTGLPDLTARLGGIGSVRQRALLADGSWRATETDSTYDSDGLVVSVDDKGDGTAATPETCTTTSYAQNAAANMLAFPAEAIKISAACGTTPDASNTLADTRNIYDGKGFGTLGATGDISETQALDHYDSSGVAQLKTIGTTTYDDYGRTTSVTNAVGATTSSAFTPTTGALPTSITSTQPAVAPATTGWKSTTTYDPMRSVPLTTTDPNGRITDVTYDPLGRISAVWLPGRAKANKSPNTKFAYALNNTTPSVVTTETLREDESYGIDYKLYDGLLRLRQEQQNSGDGGSGRLISDTYYDSHGWTVKSNADYYNTADPSTTLYVVNDDQVPSQTGTYFDGMGRPVAQALSSYAVEQWRSTTAYPGADRVDVTPPPGASATSTVKDALGRTTGLLQFHGPTPSGSADTTHYHYNSAGQQDRVTDSAGNTWSTSYDLRGRKASSTDPDTGTTKYTYDDLDQVTSTTDARGKTLAYTYDALGRKTAEYSGSASGTKLASWTYDSLAKGYPTSSSRFVGGNAYTTSVTGYDTGYRPTGSSVTIPASEGKLAGTYKTGMVYTPNVGLLDSTTMPAAGGLTAETVYYAYNIAGQLLLASGDADYLSGMNYTPFGEVQRSTTGDVPNQVVQTNSYDAATGRVVKSTLDKETNTVSSADVIKYTYTPAGAVTSVSDVQDTGQTDTQCFTYDYLDRLTEAWTDKGGTSTEPAPKAAGIGGCTNTRPSAANLGGPSPYWQSFGYDLTGNRTSEIDHDVTGNTDKDATHTEVYPAAGRAHPHAVQSMTTTSKAAGTSTDTFAYDESGNTTAHTTGAGTQNFTWTDEGTLDTITKTQQGDGTDFVYDADGNQLLRHDADTATLYLPGTEVVLNKAANTTTATRYYGAPGSLTVARSTDGRLTYLASDPNGTDTVAIDSATLAVQRRPMTPFGQSRSGAPAPTKWPGDKGFVGGTMDTETGLTNLGAREYDPSLGRFLSVDPLFDASNPQSINGYAYSGNTPVTSSDPTGLMQMCGASGAACYPDEWNNDGTPNTDGNRSTTADKPKPRASHPNPKPKPKKHHHLWEKAIDWAADHVVEIAVTVVVVSVVVGCVAATAGACAGVLVAAAEGFTAGAEFGVATAVVGAAVGAGAEAVSVLGVGSAIVAGAAKMAKSARSEAGKAGAEGEAAAAKGEAGVAAGKGEAPAPKECDSFPAPTTVLLASGAAIPISQVQVGDTVEATDPLTDTTKAEKVTDVVVTLTDKDFTDTTVRTADGDQTITSTQHHPYWDASRAQWVDATDLKPGELLRQPDGALITVVKVRSYHRSVTTYNLTVDHIHTYYVLAGATPVLVHNCGGSTAGHSTACACATGTQPRLANGQMGPSLNPRPMSAPSTHGNSRNSTATNYLYVLEDASGGYLKTGITQDPAGRYSARDMAAMGADRMRVLTSGSRSDMLDLEKWIVQRWAGPFNKESHAGKLDLGL